MPFAAVHCKLDLEQLETANFTSKYTRKLPILFEKANIYNFGREKNEK